MDREELNEKLEAAFDWLAELHRHMWNWLVRWFYN